MAMSIKLAGMTPQSKRTRVKTACGCWAMSASESKSMLAMRPPHVDTGATYPASLRSMLLTVNATVEDSFCDMAKRLVNMPSRRRPVRRTSSSTTSGSIANGTM
eukprot:CAMPEP_0172780716 /NCGR_PEP_ID=MMETSP1074-20121228/203069_1 /TAXON_ID=2916 /ORGANISM="Ceratium fusus, Strain PA161109" /LENGTH=103 /DNA_ID=CAMNT_0013617693 /DNA_START=208 /DNA_END=519 /DNA_ORIENTATION=+